MKKVLLLSFSVLLVPVPAFAGEDPIPGDFSTTIGFVSDYAFRGLSQTGEGPAVQASIDWSHDSGVYAGVWGSNVDFADASLETDIYAGYSGALNGFNYDIGAIYYAYPGADSGFAYDYAEGAVSAGYDFDVAALSGAINYSPDYFKGSGDSVYAASYVDVPVTVLPFDTRVTGHAGHQWISDNAAFGADDYTDWGIGVSANIKGFDIGLKYIGTSLDEPPACADGCGDRIILSLSKTLP